MLISLLSVIGALSLAGWTYAAITPKRPRQLPSHLSVRQVDPASEEFVHSLASHLNVPLLEGNEVTLLRNGVEIFPAMLEAIDEAEHFIDFLTYVFWRGDIAVEFAKRLAAAAERGVEVRVLLDAYGAGKIEPTLVEQMESAGCRLAWFEPFRWYSLRRYNNRTHRKVLVVDGETGFTGGVGIAQEWTGNGQDAGHWRDNHFELRGPVVRYLLSAFAENWRQATGEVLVGDHLLPDQAEPGQARIVPLLGVPGGTISEVAFSYWLCISSAQKRIRLATPYMVPTRAITNSLRAAAQRGVEVELMVPGSHCDSRMVRAASQSYYEELMNAGAQIFEYEPTMLHCKSMTVDGEISIIGSANLDFRSFELNYEMNLVVQNRELTAELDAAFVADRELSNRVTSVHRALRSAWHRLRHRMVLPVRELL